MKITKTEIDGLVIIDPNCFGDHRGWFMETYNVAQMKENGIDVVFVQDNQSKSLIKGTIRGLHFQNNPMAQTKLVRCTKGAILDVAVDLRKKSPTFKKWFSIELTEENKKQLFIPQGFAHGFLTLSDDVEVQYKVDNFYNKRLDGSIRYDDPEIGIEWGVINPVLSDKDKTSPLLKDSDVNFI